MKIHFITADVLTLNSVHQNADAKQDKKIDSSIDSLAPSPQTEPSYCAKLLDWIVSIFKCIFCCGSAETIDHVKVKTQIEEILNGLQKFDFKKYKACVDALPKSVRDKIWEIAHHLYLYNLTVGQNKLIEGIYDSFLNPGEWQEESQQLESTEHAPGFANTIIDDSKRVDLKFVVFTVYSRFLETTIPVKT